MSLSLDRGTWTPVKFGDVVRNINESVKDPTAEGIERVLGLKHLDPGKLAIQRWGNTADETTFTRRVRPGQTLFGKRRAYQRKTAYAEFDAICSGDILVFAPKDPEVLLPELLPFICSTEAFYAKALETSAGSLSPRTRWSDLAKYEFLLPPPEHQSRLAELLWARERHQTALRGLLKALEVTADTLLASLVAGSREVKDVVRLARAGATPLRSRRDYYGGGIPWLKSGEVVGPSISVTEESITPLGLADSSAHLVPAGATCVAMYGDGKTRGSVGRVTIPMATNQAVLALVADERVCDPEFLYLWMRSRSSNLRNKSAGGAQKNLNKALVIGEPFPDASISEQLDAVARFRKVEEAQVRVDAELTHLAEMRRALLSHLHGSEET